MFDPTDKDFLEISLQTHLNELTLEDKRQMLAEYFDVVRDVVAPTQVEMSEQLSQVIYSAHLITRIFDELYGISERQLEEADHLSRCFDK